MLVRKVRSSCSSVMSSSDGRCSWYAALLTRMSSCPSSRTVVATASLAELRVRHVARNQDGAPALLLHRLHGLLRVRVLAQVHDRDVGALAGEQDGDRAPDTRVAAGDDGHLSVQLPRALILRGHVEGTRLQLRLESGFGLLLLRQRRLGVLAVLLRLGRLGLAPPRFGRALEPLIRSRLGLAGLGVACRPSGLHCHDPSCCSKSLTTPRMMRCRAAGGCDSPHPA